MSKAHNEEWLSEKAILDVTGISHFLFVRYRKFFTTSDRSFHGRGAGSDPYTYHPDTIKVIEWLRAHRNETRGDNERFWGLWFAGHIDIGKWLRDRFVFVLRKAALLLREHPEKRKTAVAEFARTPAKRTDPHRSVFRHIQEQNGRKLIGDWTAAIGIDPEPAISLYDPSSPVAPAFKKALGPSFLPDRALDVERMSIQRLFEIFTSANPAEIRQARLDCMALHNLVKTAEAIDWRQCHENASVIVAFERLCTLWRSFDARASVIPFLIFVRRLPEYSKDLDGRFADHALKLKSLSSR
jgi:hypothetical protein